jgi:diaminohydroxyphosphoribosylaminopyrimidine deaminase / 5-amino-6-(5-phosphoribosylamino)uracil reductase
MRSSTVFDARDYEYMARALTLARGGLYTAHPNPRVGCVLVRDGRVVGEGFHARAGEPHAEVNALGAAGGDARDATAYVTLEPCCHQGRTPPCAQALIDAGVRRVVAAMEDPNPRVRGRGFASLTTADIETQHGLMHAEAERLNCGFVSRMRRGRPWVRSKLAMSLDGRTALADGESRWISGADARMDVQRLRARSSAIMTGGGTVRADDPALTIRLTSEQLRIAGRPLQPLRVVLSASLVIDPQARVFAAPGEALVFTGDAAADKIAGFAQRNVEILSVACHDASLDLNAVMRILAEREINEVQVEAGATLNGALLRQGLIDELVIYMAPVLMGDSARGLFHLPHISRMTDRLSLRVVEVRMVGDDLRITAIPQAAGS